MAIKHKIIKLITAAVSVGLLVAGCSKNSNANFQNIAISKGFEVDRVDDMAPEFLEKMSYVDKTNQEEYEELLLEPIEHIESGYFVTKTSNEGNITGMYIRFDSAKYACCSYYAQMMKSLFQGEKYKELVSNFTSVSEPDKLTIVAFADDGVIVKEKETFCYAVGFKMEDNAVIGVALNSNDGEKMELSSEEQVKYIISELESLGLKEYSEEPWMALRNE